jgi:hypothetical protein
MMDCIHANVGVQYYITNYVENNDLKTSDELTSLFNKNIVELKSRYENMLQYRKPNTHFINIIPFIEKNYRYMLLFYSFNHPTKHLLQFIASEIVTILNISNTIDYDIDPFSYEKCILYSCIQKMVHFDIKHHSPLMKNKSNVVDIFNDVMN